MANDIDVIIQRLHDEYPSVKVKRLKVSHKADDDGLWFFSVDAKSEVQLESTSGNCPFLIESTLHPRRMWANSTEEAINVLCAELKLR